MPPLTELQLASTAMHEAGHAALYIMAGVQLSEVWVRTHEETSAARARATGGTTVGRTATLKREDFLAIIAAGEQAERRWASEMGYWNDTYEIWLSTVGASADRHRAAAVVEPTTMTFGDRPGHPADYTTTQARADAQLDPIWPGVRDLARLLVQRRTVSGQKAEELITAGP